MPRAKSRKEDHVGMYIQVPKDVHAELKALARRMRRSMDGEAVVALACHVAAQKNAPSPLPKEEEE